MGGARVQVVCDFCEEHLEANKAAFADPRLQLVVDDARAQLENWPGTFDVIIGDLADPVYGGPCYQACTHPSIRRSYLDAGPLCTEGQEQRIRLHTAQEAACGGHSIVCREEPFCRPPYTQS